MDVSEEPLVIAPKAPELDGTDKRLVLAVVAPPLAWLAQLTAGISLSAWMCGAQARWPLHVATAVALSIAAVAALHCARHRHAGAERDRGAFGGARRALAWTGLGLALLFGLLILAAMLPGLVLHPCHV